MPSDALVSRVSPFANPVLEKLYVLATPTWAFGPSMQAIRNGFLLCLPLVVAGALAILCNHLPIPAYQRAMAAAFGPGWQNGFFSLIWQGSFGALALPMLIGIAHNLVLAHNQQYPLTPVNPVTAAIVALAGFVMLLPDGQGFITYLGVQGLFASMLTGIFSTRLYLRLTHVRCLQMRIYSEGLDSAQQAFAGLFAGLLTLVFFAALGFGFRALFGLSVLEIVREVVLLPFHLDVFRHMLDTGMVYVALTHLLWFFGLHGSNVLDPMTRDIFMAAAEANQTALAMGLPPPNILTKNFLDVFVFMGGAGSSICLLAALLLASRNVSSRRLARFSLVPGLFNINEIVLFGLPVILNPIFLIPFLITPLVLTLTSYLAVRSGLTPPPVAVVEWTTPPLLNGYLATLGHFEGCLLQLANLLIGTLIYLPFVKISDRIKLQRQQQAQRQLLEIACSNVVGPSGKKCLDRSGEVGALARTLAHDLETALETGEGLYLEYQPQVDGRNGQVVGAEALVRWRHPVFGAIPAPIIVAISEDGEFMQPLGLWVLNEACAERARWREAGVIDTLKTSVNVSIRQLGDKELPEKAIACIDRWGLERKMIGIEVTESIALDPDSEHNRILNRLHEAGFSISIDDFGMGHSSLVYLKYFPVDTLKIDKVLSQDIVCSRTCEEIINTIVDLCRALGTKIVVEFVDNTEQAAKLHELGCHVFQGYLYSPPLSGDDMLKFALAPHPPVGTAAPAPANDKGAVRG